jgi:vacuolar-type H+-ATPase subunit H
MLLVLVTAGISYYYGRKITLEWLDDKIRRQAFEEAKKEYREIFEKRFEDACEGMASAIIERQKQEIERLSAEVKNLKERLKEKRK